MKNNEVSNIVFEYLREFPVEYSYFWRICEQLPDIYLVGGLIRDALIGTTTKPHDLDFMCSNEDFRKLRENGISGMETTINRHGNLRLLVDDFQIDVFCPKRFYSGFSTFNDCLAYFDISINSMGISQFGDVLDPYESRIDISKEIFYLNRSRWVSTVDPMERTVLRARLLKLMRRFPRLRCMNAWLALPDLEELFLAFPAVVFHHLQSAPELASRELHELLRQSS